MRVLALVAAVGLLAVGSSGAQSDQLVGALTHPPGIDLIKRIPGRSVGLYGFQQARVLVEAIPDALTGIVSQEEIADLAGERLNTMGIKVKQGNDQFDEYSGSPQDNDLNCLTAFDRLSCSVAVVVAVVDIPNGKAMCISLRAKRGAFLYPGAYTSVTVDDHTRLATCGDGTHDFVLEQVRGLFKDFEEDWKEANPG